MANVKKGIKRIIWILAVGCSIATWIILFSNTDLSPQKKTNKAGIGFVNWLDRHYFDIGAGDSLAFLIVQRILENRHSELEAIKTKIENGVKADSIERWPYIWELKSPIDLETWRAQKRKQRTVEEFEVFVARRFLWRNRLREALRVNENEIKQTFPDIDIKGIMLRYEVDNQSIKFNARQFIKPESYFNITYQKPLGLIISLILFGFIPFMVIWFLWFLTQWVISGFRN